MVTFALCGKLLLFLAGLTIVIDLLDPVKLRARGVRIRKPRAPRYVWDYSS